MDREQVDGWLTGVDELLAGRRDDDLVSDDAMRWTPDLPPPSLPWPVLDEAAFRMWVAPEVVAATFRRVARAFAELQELLAAQGTAMARFAEQARQLQPRLRVVVDETHVFSDRDPRLQRVIEMRRNRDTGPPLSPLGRRGR